MLPYRFMVSRPPLADILPKETLLSTVAGKARQLQAHYDKELNYSNRHELAAKLLIFSNDRSTTISHKKHAKQIKATQIFLTSTEKQIRKKLNI